MPPPSPAPLGPGAQDTSELNNLLQIIATSAALLSEEQGRSREQRMRCLEMLRAAAGRAQTIVASFAQTCGGTAMREVLQSGIAPAPGVNRALTALRERPSLLLVDDEVMALRSIEIVLRAQGFDVTTASSGLEAIDLLRCNPSAFDLALIDLTMPMLDGEQTFRKLREIRRDLPAILCTGFVPQERFDQLMSVGFIGFLHKPTEPDDMIAFIRAALERLKSERAA